MTCVQGGYNNWYTLKFDGSTEDKFEMLFDSKLARPMTWQDASDYTAQKIAENYSNLYLGLSGGLDSEYVANVFLRNNIPFTPVIICLPQSIEHDYALKWCRDHNIKPKVVEFELDDRRLYPEIARLVKALNFYSNGCVVNSWLTNWVIEQGGHLVTGEPTLGQRYYHRPITELMDVWWIQFTSQLVFPDYDHPGAFLSYTPEIFLSQALHLDTTLDDAESRSKLHNIPYRPKLRYPVEIISRPRLLDIIKIHKLQPASLSPKDGGCSWDRKTLIEKLHV